MNNRLLEIVKNPDLLSFNDIEILEKEISKNPYIQSFRALQLLATHRFKGEDFAAKLSETAAFTTDKKILYQLIHQKKIEEKLSVEDLNTINTNIHSESLVEKDELSKVEKLIATPETRFQEIEIEQFNLPNEVFIDGELNRILFEGEEDFLNEETLSIDLEATQESGKIVIASTEANSGEFAHTTHKFTSETIIKEEKIKNEDVILDNSAELSFHGIDKNIQVEDEIINEKQSLSLKQIETVSQDFDATIRIFTTETFINEDAIKSEEKIIESGAELSFHGESEFLPNVKIKIKAEVVPYFKAENKMSKHEAEIQKLIAEVEAKMKKSSVKNVVNEDDLIENHSLNYTGISNEEHEEKVLENQKNEDNSKVEVEKNEVVSSWKAIDFSTKKSVFRNNEISEKTESSVEKEELIEEKLEEIQKNPNELIISNEEKVIDSETAEKINENSLDEEISNVPVFINTWQTWLKLNPETPVIKENIRQKAIESFIEREPKISKLKEESSFIIKDKGDNISHLMTETLANLYLDQKLYSKAQKAFELLIEKNPAKADSFNEKLLKIKELRNQKF
ncbi:hypothetical protein [Halpernia sp. GG3]